MDKNGLKSVILVLLKEDATLEAKISKIISDLPPAPAPTANKKPTSTPTSTPISKTRTQSVGSTVKKPATPVSGSASPSIHLSPAVQTGLLFLC